MLHGVMLFIHLAAAVFWIGGIFFVQVALRPALVDLEPQARLIMITKALTRYFNGVGLCIVLILGSGFVMMHGMAGGGSVFAAPAYVHAMLGLGVLMMLMYAHTMAAPFRRLRMAVAARDWAAGGAAMAQIRVQGASNLGLGLLTIAVAVIGRAHG